MNAPMPNKLDAPETATPPKPTPPARRARRPVAASATPVRVKAPLTEQDLAAAKERAQAKLAFKKELAAINTKQASAKLLATCIKRLAKMIPEHRLILAEHQLMPVATPPLPMN